MEDERDAMVEGFKISTQIMIERLKDLETANFQQWPDTAQVMGRINQGFNRDGKSNSQ